MHIARIGENIKTFIKVRKKRQKLSDDKNKIKNIV